MSMYLIISVGIRSLYFEDKSIEQIMDELSLWYDIEVFFRNNISRNRHFSGSLPRYREIDDMLKVIEKLPMSVSR